MRRTGRAMPRELYRGIERDLYYWSALVQIIPLDSEDEYKALTIQFMQQTQEAGGERTCRVRMIGEDVVVLTATNDLMVHSGQAPRK